MYIQALREVRIHDSIYLKHIPSFLKKQTSNVYIVTRGKICFLLEILVLIEFMTDNVITMQIVLSMNSAIYSDS